MYILCAHKLKFSSYNFMLLLSFHMSRLCEKKMSLIVIKMMRKEAPDFPSSHGHTTTYRLTP